MTINDQRTNAKKRKKNVILLIGSCGMDRLLSVPTYPNADAKVRTTAYNEVGGGNAANTASAMALLSNASFIKEHNFCIKLLTKVGDDYVGKQLIDELNEAGVDTSSDLFQIGGPETTTGFTTIIVSTGEHTRTCLHTPGTCGELTIEDDLASINMDTLFEDVIHVHSDARQTEVALAVAKEARSRGISVSLDAEKDRQTKDLDRLLEVATTIFTNSQQIDTYLDRLTGELEEERNNRAATSATMLTIENKSTTRTATTLSDKDTYFYAKAIKPSAYFTKWHNQKDKEVVITKGEKGALQVKCNSLSQLKDEDLSLSEEEIHVISDEDTDFINVKHKFASKTQKSETCGTNDEISNDLAKISSYAANYVINRAGVLSDVNIIDTTGAGDAFIGGYLLAKLAMTSCSKNKSHGDDNDIIQLCLKFGSWVGGKKLGGPGSRNALPKGTEVDEKLGTNLDSVRQSLGTVLTPFTTGTGKGIISA